MDYITLREPETQHDYRPSHPVKPDWLIEADSARKFTEAQWLELCDNPDATQAQIDRAWEMKHDADLYYYDLYDYWSRGEVPASVLLQIEQRSDDVIPFGRTINVETNN